MYRPSPAPTLATGRQRRSEPSAQQAAVQQPQRQPQHAAAVAAAQDRPPTCDYHRALHAALSTKRPRFATTSPLLRQPLPPLAEGDSCCSGSDHFGCSAAAAAAAADLSVALASRSIVRARPSGGAASRQCARDPSLASSRGGAPPQGARRPQSLPFRAAQRAPSRGARRAMSSALRSTSTARSARALPAARASRAVLQRGRARVPPLR